MPTNPQETAFFKSLQNKTHRPGIAVIIPAAGSGKRMGGSLPKQFLEIAGVPLLVYTLHAFTLRRDIDEIILVAAADMQEKIKQLCNTFFVTESRIKFVVGGKRRQDSVAAGLAQCAASLVMVHDAARPLVSQEILDRCCQALYKEKSFLTAIPVADTIKKVADNKITATLERSELMRAQTPQGAPTELLKECFTQLAFLGDKNCTDESSLLELAGVSVEIVAGEESNFKITRAEDLQLAEPLLKNISLSRKPSLSVDIPCHDSPRIGHGFDAHRLAKNRKLILGGIEIPFDKGLAGHSDADVLTHAVCDALLGAAGLGDIGKAFPDSDNAFKDIYSIVLLERVVQKIIRHWQISNIDITLICQAPKIAPYIEAMKEKIAAACSLKKEQLNIKATTEEKMGYTGRGEGISCHATVLLIHQ